eukprot:GILI01001417.1.p1 GENE.GILI01001417.1~~GILI01001417.1.p1  ORF type:complete len:208 (+),score=65.36 GILI01001417.1:65-688(+)
MQRHEEDESIYNLIPREYVPPPKPPMYRSKFSQSPPPETTSHNRTREKVKPSVPKSSERPLMGLRSTKNFVVSNAVENILAAPKKVNQSPKRFVEKADYGQVPEYLQKIKSDIQEEYEFVRRMQEQEEEERRSHVRPLTEEEKEALVNALKAKWDKVNREYQNMTHVVKLDTIGKVRRKEEYEATLAQIEKDIERISKKNILVDTTS